MVTAFPANVSSCGEAETSELGEPYHRHFTVQSTTLTPEYDGNPDHRMMSELHQAVSTTGSGNNRSGQEIDM